MKLRSLFEGAGAAILVFSAHLFSSLSPYHLDAYYSLLPIRSVWGGYAIDLVVLTAVLAIAFFYLHRQPKGFASLGWIIPFFWLLRMAVLHLDPTILPAGATEILRNLQTTWHGHACIFGITAVAFLLWLLRRPWYANLIQGTLFVTSLLGASFLFLFPKLVYQSLHAVPPDRDHYEQPIADGRAQQHENRILWILFDEASYKLIYEQRPRDLDLPNFDRFRQTSVSFNHVEPAGYYTGFILPSLLLNHSVDAVRSDINGKLNIHINGQPGWSAFDEKQTLFADARRMGWTTGLSGYYIPYCRILPTILDRCSWGAEQVPSLHMRPELSAWRNSLQAIPPLRTRGNTSLPDNLVLLHTYNYHKEMDYAARLIAEKEIHFLLLHIGLPHPPGIYDRKTHQLGKPGSYIDNLALADVALGTLLQQIEASADASHTTVILTSDHSWRTELWKSTTPMSPEEKVYGKDFDSRPLLLIHFPGQKQGQTISASLPELREHDLIEAMLANEHFTEEHLLRFAAAQQIR